MCAKNLFVLVVLLLANVSKMLLASSNSDLVEAMRMDGGSGEEYVGGSDDTGNNKVRGFFGGGGGGGASLSTGMGARFPLFSRLFGGGNRGFNGQVQGYFYNGPTASGQQGYANTAAVPFGGFPLNPYFAGQGFTGLPSMLGASQYSYPNYYGYGYGYPMAK